MAQNIYDDATFFKGYSALARSERGLDGAPEWPRLRRLLPTLEGARVIDLGCGFGWFAKYAADNHATHISAYDLSENMLTRARTENGDPHITYAQADLNALKLTPASADLVYSSLALHYLTELKALFGEIARALKPGGAFVFSVEHPMFTAPQNPQWIKGEKGEKGWPINNYLIEGPRTTNWLADGVVKQHRTVSTYLNLLIANGLTLAHVEEWGPSDRQLADNPSLADERQRPTFLLIAAQKNL